MINKISLFTFLSTIQKVTNICVIVSGTSLLALILSNSYLLVALTANQRLDHLRHVHLQSKRVLKHSSIWLVSPQLHTNQQLFQYFYKQLNKIQLQCPLEAITMMYMIILRIGGSFICIGITSFDFTNSPNYKVLNLCLIYTENIIETFNIYLLFSQNCYPYFSPKMLGKSRLTFN